MLSCASNNDYSILKNESTKVPKDKAYFKNIYDSKYKVFNHKEIDTNSLYKLEYYTLNKVKYFHRYEHVDFIKFYTNGRVNKFNYYMNYSVNEKVNKENIRINLDPKFSGYRGVFYENDGSFYIDFSEPITELRNYGISKYEIVSISRDTLKIRKNKKNSSIYVYKRQKLPLDSLKYKANW